VLRVAVPGQPLVLDKQPLTGADPAAARKGSRRAWWPKVGDWADTPVYDLAALRPGNRIAGPAIIEAEYTTGVIPPGATFGIDEYGLGLLEAAG
jgi:N-methylhydantoinase A/oxoprolinase/acetone carboxylase beta subunit